MSLDRRKRRWLIAAGAVLYFGPASAHAVPTQPGELTNPLIPAETCANCHAYLNPMDHDAQPWYSASVGWEGSMMGNAARDPVFWAGVAIADQDAPGETEDCVRCHSPRAFLEGRGDVIAFDDLDPTDHEGVTCETCHRAIDDGVIGNAQYTIDNILVNGLVPRRGPWDYTDGIPEPGHSWINDPFIGSSELCGVCHDVTVDNPRVDDDGNDLGVPFNEQRTYSEWANSVFAQAGADFASCQDCHMPAVDDKGGCLNYIDDFRHATGGRRHDLVGANRFMLEILRGVWGSAGMDIIADQIYDNSIARTEELVVTSATLDAAPPTEVHLGDGLGGLAITVTNETGHKLPTGYSEGRIMWLEVIATYNDDVVFSSGAWDQAAGIEDDPLLRTYQAVADDLATGTTFHLLLNNHWVEDTRIPPRGLTQDIETDPVGDRYTLQGDNTWPNFDEYTYDFPGNADVVDATPGDTSDDELQVSIRLRYVINTAEYIEFLAEENNTNEAGNEVAMLFDTAGGATPIDLAEPVTLTIPISGFGATGGTSTGSVDSTSDDGLTTTPLTTGPPTTADGAGTGDTGQDDDGDGGCGCRHDHRGPGAVLVLVALAALRRRRD